MPQCWKDQTFLFSPKNLCPPRKNKTAEPNEENNKTGAFESLTFNGSSLSSLSLPKQGKQEPVRPVEGMLAATVGKMKSMTCIAVKKLENRHGRLAGGVRGVTVTNQTKKL